MHVLRKASQLACLLAMLAVASLVKRVADNHKSFGAFIALNVAVTLLALTGIFGLTAGFAWGWFAAASVVTVGFAAVMLTMISAGQLVRAESTREEKRP
jgi:hypothetical protein